MLAVNYTTMRNNLKEYCDKATDNGETIIVTRKGERNVVNNITKWKRSCETLSISQKLIELLTSFTQEKVKFMS